jgi:hypothetical protein
MILFNDAGLVISADEAANEHIELIKKMHSELCKWRREALWWRDAATGKLWLDAIIELEDEEEF